MASRERVREARWQQTPGCRPASRVTIGLLFVEPISCSTPVMPARFERPPDVGRNTFAVLGGREEVAAGI